MKILWATGPHTKALHDPTPQAGLTTSRQPYIGMAYCIFNGVAPCYRVWPNKSATD